MTIRNTARFGAYDYKRTRPTPKQLRESKTMVWKIGLGDGDYAASYDFGSGYMIICLSYGTTVADLDHDLVFDHSIDHGRFCEALQAGLMRIEYNNDDKHTHNSHFNTTPVDAEDEHPDILDCIPAHDSFDNLYFEAVHRPLLNVAFLEVGDNLSCKLFILHCFFDFSFRELGLMFGFSHTTARMKYNRVLEKVRLNYTRNMFD